MKNITFRASSIGKLMIGGNEFTESNDRRLEALLAKQRGEILHAGTQKPLLMTAKDEIELEQLIDKKNTPFQFGETAKRFIEDDWLRHQYGYDEPIVSKEILKGLLCEQDSISLLSEVVPSKQFRVKNKTPKRDDFFSGNCDIDLDQEDTIEDVKTSWDIGTFFRVQKIPELYYAQGQTYMHLYGREKFRLAYCLVSTPEELIKEEEKRFWFRFGCDDENIHYKEVSAKIRKNHIVDHIDQNLRVKVFEFHKDNDYINELKKRVEYARDYCNSLYLNMTI